MLLIGHLCTNFIEIFIDIHIFSVKKMRFQMASAKRGAFCLCLNVLTYFHPNAFKQLMINDNSSNNNHRWIRLQITMIWAEPGKVKLKSKQQFMQICQFQITMTIKTPILCVTVDIIIIWLTRYLTCLFLDLWHADSSAIGYINSYQWCFEIIYETYFTLRWESSFISNIHISCTRI